MKKFVYNVELTISKKTLKLRGFYDTGNCFQIGKLPVIFLKNNKSNLIGGISTFDTFYKRNFKKGLLKIKTGSNSLIKEVLILEVSNKENFFGCDCLLNSSIF